MKLSLHRCKVCGARWLLWPDEINHGGWNLLDKYQRPGSCCDNAAMGEQIEHLRDFNLGPAVPVQDAPHRCVGCGHRWNASTAVGELCGDCWRVAQSVLQPAASAAPAVQDALTTLPLKWREESCRYRDMAIVSDRAQSESAGPFERGVAFGRSLCAKDLEAALRREVL